MSERLRVALVEDDRTTREALRLLIGGTPGYTCVATFASAEEALRLPPREPPDVLLVDIDLPGIQGSEAVAPLRVRFPDSTVLMLTAFEDEEKILRSLCNGASGYILKKTPPARLLEYVREGVAGGAPFSPEIAARVVALFRKFAPQPRTETRLTETELRLLGLLAAGHSYHSAADTMAVTVNTVRTHVRAIYDKLHVHSKSAAVAKALRSGLI